MDSIQSVFFSENEIETIINKTAEKLAKTFRTDFESELSFLKEFAKNDFAIHSLVIARHEIIDCIDMMDRHEVITEINKIKEDLKNNHKQPAATKEIEPDSIEALLMDLQ